MKRTTRLAVGLWIGCLAFTGVNAGEKTTRGMQASADQYRAELRMEANAPGLPRKQLKRLTTVMNVRKREKAIAMAKMERFREEREMAFASAGAPKIMVVVHGSGRSEVADRSSAGSRFIPASSRSVTVNEEPALPRRRSILEEGIDDDFLIQYYKDKILARAGDQVVKDSYERAATAGMPNEPLEPPYAVPVEGKAGFATSPFTRASGFIDVRGYDSGTEVVDPYSGRHMLVP